MVYSLSVAGASMMSKFACTCEYTLSPPFHFQRNHSPTPPPPTTESTRVEIQEADRQEAANVAYAINNDAAPISIASKHVPIRIRSLMRFVTLLGVRKLHGRCGSPPAIEILKTKHKRKTERPSAKPLRPSAQSSKNLPTSPKATTTMPNSHSSTQFRLRIIASKPTHSNPTHSRHTNSTMACCLVLATCSLSLSLCLPYCLHIHIQSSIVIRAKTYPSAHTETAGTQNIAYIHARMPLNHSHTEQISLQTFAK